MTLFASTTLWLHVSSDFQYLVIVDFEATCDEGALEERKVDTVAMLHLIVPFADGNVIRRQVSRHNQEIIEFPWVVLDMTHRDKRMQI